MTRADVSVVKQVIGTAMPGRPLTYKLVVRNHGPSYALGVVVTDTLPAEVSYTGAVPTPVSGPNPLVWQLGTLAVNESRTIEVQVTVLPTVTASFSNTALVGSSTTDPDPQDNKSTVTSPIYNIDLSVSKTDGRSNVLGGDTLVYELTIRNGGNISATGVIVRDVLPAYTSFIGASNGGTASGGTVTWPAFNLAPAASVTRTVKVLLGATPSGLIVITNTATVTDDGAHGVDLAPDNNTGIDQDFVVGAPELSLAKTDVLGYMYPYGTFRYELTYRNDGNRGAAGVVITETVPQYTTFNAAQSTSGWSCANGRPAGTICTFTVGSVPAGTGGIVYFAVTVPNALPSGVTKIVNTAQIGDNGQNGVDPNPGNNTATDTTNISAAPDLRITKSDGGATAAPGQVVVYELNYKNVGTQTASGVVVEETVPANTRFNAARSTPGWSCADGSPAGTLCTFNVGALNYNQSGGVSFAVMVDNPLPAGVNQVANTATVHDDRQNGADPNPADNTASDTTPTTGGPDLQLRKTDGGASAQPGGTVVYQLDYSNTGNRNAAGVVITETVPANSTFVAAGSTPGWSCAHGSPAGTVCTFALGSLAVGASGSVQFAVKVNDPLAVGVSVISNSASIGDDGRNGADQNPNNNTASDTTPTTGGPDLQLRKTDGGASAQPGDTVVYQLDYSNTGNRNAAGVVITETVPANSTFVAAGSTPGWSCAHGSPAGTVCTFALGSLAVGASGSVQFAVKVNDPLAVGVSVISNSASIGDDGRNGADQNPNNNTASDTTPTTGGPDLQLRKTDGGASAQPGDTVVYQLDYSNTGNRNAAGVVITETVPANGTFVAAGSTPGWSCAHGSPAGTVCTFALGSLAVGASGSVQFAVKVNDPLAVGVSVISNNASIGDDGRNGADQNPADNTASDTTPIVAAPDLKLSKSDAGVETTPAGLVVYTLDYANVGNVLATGVVVTEVVPANSTFTAGDSTPGWSCANGSPSGTICTFNIGSLPAGASGAIRFAVTVASPLPAGVAQLANTAVIGDDGRHGADPTPVNNTAGDITPIQAAPDLKIHKSDGGIQPQPGGILTYTLTYTNTGNQGATGVVITEVVPANTRFSAANSTPGWSCADGSPAGTVCTLIVGSLPVGVSGTVKFAVTVDKPLPAAVKTLANIAAIGDDGKNGADPNPSNNSSGVTTPIGTPTALTLLSFVSVQQGAAIELQWATGAEAGTWSFHLWRSTSGDLGTAERITSQPIAATGESGGASYTFTDTEVQVGVTYTYWLEEIHLDGTSRTYGPLVTALRGSDPPRSRSFLPLINR